MDSITKVCSKCNLQKPISDFCIDKRRKHGVGSICKKCHNVASLRWNKNNPERVRQNFISYIAENLERVVSNTREWRKNNPEKYKSQKKRWYEKNLDKNNLYVQNRNARIKHSGGKITPEEWGELKRKYGYMCICCRRTDVNLAMDHVIPLSLGGANVIDNIQPLCKSCNSRKNTKIIDYRIGFVV